MSSPKGIARRPMDLVACGALCLSALLAGGSCPVEAETYVLTGAWGSAGSGDGQFNAPSRMRLDPSGFVYVTDPGNHRLQKFSRSGNWVATWTSWAGGFFARPTGVALDADGYVYVSDSEKFCVQKFRGDGTWVAKWGGRWEMPFGGVYGLDADNCGHVYLADPDRDTNCVWELASDGTILADWDWGWCEDAVDVAVDATGYVYILAGFDDVMSKTRSDGSLVATWGDEGSGDGEFENPESVAVDASGYVYVADTDNNRVQTFRTDGTFVAQWGSAGSGDGQLSGPTGVAADAYGYVYVADTGNNRVQKFHELRRYQPDLVIGASQGQPELGRGAYEWVPVLQLRVCQLQRGGKAVFPLLLDNDGLRRDGCSIAGPAGGQGWTIRYYDAWTGGTDITSQVTGAGWRLRALDPAASHKLRVEVSPTSRTPVGAHKPLLVTATSTNDPRMKDVVKLVSVLRSATSIAGAPAQVSGLAAPPSRAGTQVVFTLSAPATVEAHVLNLAGRPIRSLCQGAICQAGTNTLLWNAQSDAGLAVPNGTYLIELVARGDDGSQSRALARVTINR